MKKEEIKLNLSYVMKALRIDKNYYKLNIFVDDGEVAVSYEKGAKIKHDALSKESEVKDE